jgi:hypothetical protein
MPDRLAGHDRARDRALAHGERVIPLAGVIAALKAGGTPFKFVGGAIDLATASDHLKIFPAAYVLPLQDGAGRQPARGRATP